MRVRIREALVEGGKFMLHGDGIYQQMEHGTGGWYRLIPEKVYPNRDDASDPGMKRPEPCE